VAVLERSVVPVGLVLGELLTTDRSSWGDAPHVPPHLPGFRLVGRRPPRSACGLPPPLSDQSQEAAEWAAVDPDLRDPSYGEPAVSAAWSSASSHDGALLPGGGTPRTTGSRRSG